MNHPYLPVLVFFGVALMVPIASLTLARVWMNFFTPIKRGTEKNALYECGVNPLAERQNRFHSHLTSNILKHLQGTIVPNQLEESTASLRKVGLDLRPLIGHELRSALVLVVTFTW